MCRGKMGQQVAAAPSTNPREMKKMETDIEQLAEEYRALQASRQQLEDDILRSDTLVPSQSNELTRGPPELAQHFPL
jgi:hypothetical protein